MGGAFNACTAEKGEGKTGMSQAVDGRDGASDINDAALQALSSSIGQSARMELKQVINLSFALRNVPKLDAKSKSDCFVVFYALRGAGNQVVKQKIGTTETIWDDSNPDFVKQFDVDYFFEEQQKFLVEAYDMDDESRANDLTK